MREDDEIKAALREAEKAAAEFPGHPNRGAAAAAVAAFLRALPGFPLPVGAVLTDGPLYPQLLGHLAAAVARAAKDTGA